LLTQDVWAAIDPAGTSAGWPGSRGLGSDSSPSCCIAGRIGPECVRGRVELSEGRGQQQLAEEARQLFPLSIIKGAEKPLLVLEVVDDSLVNELDATVRERHHATPAIGRVGLTLDESHRLEAIETVGHGARRENDRVEEPSWVHPIGRAGSAQCREDEVLAKRDSTTGENACKAGGLQKPKARDSLERVRRRYVEVRPLAIPLFDDSIDFIH